MMTIDAAWSVLAAVDQLAQAHGLTVDARLEYRTLTRKLRILFRRGGWIECSVLVDEDQIKRCATLAEVISLFETESATALCARRGAAPS